MSAHAIKTTVLVEDLRIETYIGHHASEREHSQPISIGLACTIANPEVPDDELSNSFDYIPVVEEAKRIALSRTRLLVETFAEELADLCFQYPNVQSVIVSVRKLNKLPSVSAVGVERTFERK